jgi:hypothetical protein
MSWLIRSSISLLLNIPIGRCILSVVASVAKFSLLRWYVRPEVITNVVLQNSNDFEIHQKVIECVIPNYVVSARKVFMNVLGDFLSNQILTFVVTFHQMSVKPFCSFFKVFKNESSNWIIVTFFSLTRKRT